MIKNNIVLGGRLSKVLTDDLKVLVPDQQFISFNDSDLINRLIHYKGINWFKSIDRIILLDTAFTSLTDWTSTDDMFSYLKDKQFIIANRFVNFTPERYRSKGNVTIYEPKNEELNIDYLATLLKQ